MEQKMAFYLITGLIVLAIIVAVAARFFGDGGLIESARGNLTGQVSISYAPTSSEGKTDSAVTLERPIQMAGGTYVYTIDIRPRLMVNGKGGADVKAMISFKGVSAWATDSSTGPEKETFHAVAGGIAQPILAAKITSDVPPIRDASGAEYPNKHPIIVKSRTDKPIIVTAYLSRARELPDLFSETCRVKFEMECENELKYSGYMRGGEGTDLEQHIDLCGGVVDIKLLDKPDCALERAEADISYDGNRDFVVTETVGMSFWRDTECVKRTADIRELLVLCAGDRLGGESLLKTWYSTD